MKITVKRSWIPWGRPSIVVDCSKEIDYVCIHGAKWRYITNTIKYDKPDIRNIIKICEI